MSSPTSATKDRVVSIHYTLTLNGGDVIDKSGDEPLSYLHGHDNIVPGLERQLEGKVPGDKLTAVVSPADGYGEKLENAKRAVPKSALPEDAPLEVGMQFVMEDKDGDLSPMWLVGVETDRVVFDLNHPLAGETLNFDVEVVEVRSATEEELAHGHVHGPHDHHH